MILTVPWLPESPCWLLAHGYEEEGLEVLAALEGDGATKHDEVVQVQKLEILEALEMEKQTNIGWGEIFRGETGNTGMIRRLVLGMGGSIPILCKRWIARTRELILSSF